MVAARVHRNVLAVVVAAAFAVSCVSSTPPPTETPSPGSTASAPSGAAPSSPPGTLRAETPVVLLDVEVAPAVSNPGVTTPRPGGGSQNGPTALAVDGEGSIYLWDEARLRIVVYEKGGRYARDIPLPSVAPEAEALLIHAGRLYLRENTPTGSTLEYEVDVATGRMLRVGATGAASIYPRTRVGKTPRLPGTNVDLGGDALGFRYRLDRSTSTRLLQRLDSSGSVLAQSVEPVPSFLVDTYLASDGALYGLVDRALADGHVYVYRLLSTAGAAPAERAAAEEPAPVVAGMRVPDDVAVIYAGLPGAKLAARERETLWATLTRAQPASEQRRIEPILRFQASWSDGRKSEIASDGQAATIDGVLQTPPLPGLNTLAAWSASRPSDLAFHASRGTVVQIPDLTEGAATTTRYLTRSETDALVAAIGGSVWVRERAVPRPLEDPFPRIHLRLGGIVTLQPVGGHHLALGRSGGLAAPGLEALVRALTPVAPTTGIAALYGATELTITDHTGAQNLSRWKATVVRALLGAETHPPAGTATFTLTFALPGGRREDVAVDETGFTYLGRHYARAGLTYLLGLRGVP